MARAHQGVEAERAGRNAIQMPTPKGQPDAVRAGPWMRTERASAQRRKPVRSPVAPPSPVAWCVRFDRRPGGAEKWSWESGGQGHHPGGCVQRDRRASPSVQTPTIVSCRSQITARSRRGVEALGGDREPASRSPRPVEGRGTGESPAARARSRLGRRGVDGNDGRVDRRAGGRRWPRRGGAGSPERPFRDVEAAGGRTSFSPTGTRRTASGGATGRAARAGHRENRVRRRLGSHRPVLSRTRSSGETRSLAEEPQPLAAAAAQRARDDHDGRPALRPPSGAGGRSPCPSTRDGR